MTETALDLAHRDMEASDAARLRFYASLADAELFVLLEREAEGDAIEPRLFPTEDGDLVLAFDTETRLADFVGAAAAFAVLPGRVLAELLATEGLSLGVNLDVAPSATLLPPDALRWLVQTLQSEGPAAETRHVAEVSPPTGLPEPLLAALGEKLLRAQGVAEAALLAQVRYGDGARGHVLALLGADAAAQPALARMVSEALVFSGVEAGVLDVMFLDPDAALAHRMSGVAMRLEIPAPASAEPAAPVAPGSDPDRPPRLR